MIRAAIMWSVLMTSRIFGRKELCNELTWNGYAWYAYCESFHAFSVSFILSCVSVAAIEFLLMPLSSQKDLRKRSFYWMAFL